MKGGEVVRFLVVFSSLWLMSSAVFGFSVNSYYCAANRQYVSLGDSIDQVTRACGQPTETKPWSNIQEEIVPVEQWLYQTQEPVIRTLPKDEQPHAAFSLALVVNFYKGQVSRMLSFGQEVQESYYCNLNVPIKTGMRAATVRQICGNPAMAREVKQRTKKKVSTELMYIYRPESYDRPVTFYFEQFKLVKIDAP